MWADREPTAEEKHLGTGAQTDFGRACLALGIRGHAVRISTAKVCPAKSRFSEFRRLNRQALKAHFLCYFRNSARLSNAIT